jgi:hypothetical protein
VLAPPGDEADPRERHPDLAEHLDRDEEAATMRPSATSRKLERSGLSMKMSRPLARNPPAAMSSVAGTRLFRWPASNARTAPGSEAAKLTTMATGEMRRLNRNWSPGWVGSRE